MLRVTNGDSTARLIERTGIGGEVLPGRDVLHEGPAPDGLDAADLACERAAFLAGCGDGDETTIRDELVRRDRALAEIPDETEVVLWFERDLYVRF